MQPKQEPKQNLWYKGEIHSKSAEKEDSNRKNPYLKTYESDDEISTSKSLL